MNLPEMEIFCRRRRFFWPEPEVKNPKFAQY
jgi:hypothetical protein